MAAPSSLGLILAFSSSAAEAFHEATQKALVSRMPHPELALALKAGLIAVVFLASYFQQPDAWSRCLATFRSQEFLTAWAVAGVVNVLANFLVILGLRRGQISDTVPFLSLSPMFLLGSGYVFLDEVVDLKGTLGVSIIALGGVWLSRASVTPGVPKGGVATASCEQISAMRRLPPGTGIYIIVALIQSISSAFDKRGVRAAAAPELYGATISATVALCALGKFALQKLAQRSMPPLETHKAAAPTDQASCKTGASQGASLALLACCLKMIAYWCQLKASESLYSAHISAIRKSGMLLVLLLGRLFFNEEVGRKLLPVSTMLAGVALLATF